MTDIERDILTTLDEGAVMAVMAAMGRRGGQAGTGVSKRRGPAHYHAMVARRSELAVERKRKLTARADRARLRRLARAA